MILIICNKKRHWINSQDYVASMVSHIRLSNKTQIRGEALSAPKEFLLEGTNSKKEQFEYLAPHTRTFYRRPQAAS